MTELKRTPLYDVQAAAGGRMVPFAGYEMAVQFQGLMAEHEAVRERAGLFDVSHMGEVIITGAQALDAVQHLITNDAAKLGPGRACYTVMCTANGGIVDDLIVYREADDRFFLCINASRRAEDLAHIREVTGNFDCSVEDCSDDYAQIALQGPRAHDILRTLTSAEIDGMKPFSWQDATVAGQENVRIAATGYTGEPGFELYCKSDQAEALWNAVVAAGEPHGLALCGLGARDTLRLEMKYPLYGNDIDLDHSPIEAGLGWVVKLKSKGDFMGRSVLEKQKAEGADRKWVGFKMLERGIPRQGYPICIDGQEIGVVTSGTHSPSLGEAIGAGYVPASVAQEGQTLQIMIRNKPAQAQIVPTPFYQRGK